MLDTVPYFRVSGDPSLPGWKAETEENRYAVSWKLNRTFHFCSGMHEKVVIQEKQLKKIRLMQTIWLPGNTWH